MTKVARSHGRGAQPFDTVTHGDGIPSRTADAG